MSESTLYRKVGRRYVPVAAEKVWDSLQNGTWVVCIDKGMRRCVRYVSQVPVVDQFAKALDLGGRIAPMILEAGEARVSPRYVTPKERRAVKAFQEVMGSDAPVWMEYDSAQGMAEKVAGECVRLFCPAERLDPSREDSPPRTPETLACAAALEYARWVVDEARGDPDRCHLVEPGEHLIAQLEEVLGK